MSDIDSDIDENNYFKTPTIQDQLEDFQHFMCDLTRKMSIIENRTLENQDEIERLNVRLIQHQTSYTKITTVIINLLTALLILLVIIHL